MLKKIALIGTFFVVLAIAGCNSNGSVPAPAQPDSVQTAQTPPAIPQNTQTAQLPGAPAQQTTAKDTTYILPNITSGNKVTITGTIKPGQTLSINNNNVRADASGNYSYDIPATEGLNSIDFKVYYSNGPLVRHEVKTLTFKPTPTLNVITSSNSITPVINLYGTTVPKSDLSINGFPVAVNMDGTFSEPVGLKPGANKFDFLVIKDGKQYTQSKTITFTPPSPTIQFSMPQYNSSISSSINSIIVEGITEPNNLIQVFVNNSNSTTNANSAEYPGSVDSSGKFSTTVNLSPGVNTITVVATTPYQKTTRKELKVIAK